MRVFGAIVDALVLAMLERQALVLTRWAVASQFVGDKRSGDVALVFICPAATRVTLCRSGPANRRTIRAFTTSVNHTVNGVRVRSKMVLDVTEPRLPHPEHMNLASLRCQRPECLHAGPWHR